MISNLRIAIPIIGSKIWLGGVTYIELLIKGVSMLPQKERPKLLLVVTEDILDALELHRPLLPLLDDILFLGNDIAKAEQILHHPFKHVSSGNALLKEFDFFYPVQANVWPDACSASWIPDFQHVHLPEFFFPQELQGRNIAFQRIASLAKLLVLSSKDAEKDFRRLYPHSKPVIRILSFHTMMPDELYSVNPSDIQQKYGLPDEFLICSNQFWAHKNHMLVFEAMAALKRPWKAVHLVCTGSTGDYRFPEYFKHVKQKIADLGINDYVHILGIIPRNDQLQLMRRSLAVIQPSLFEGWSTVVEDARALGKTMILSDLDVHKEQAPKNAVFFQRHNRDDLIQKIMEILPNLKPGPNLKCEQQARNESKELVRSYALQFCCIAIEAQYLFGKLTTKTLIKDNKTRNNDKEQYKVIHLTKIVEEIENLLSSNKFNEASIILTQALQQYPHSPDLHNLNALLKLYLKDSEGAKGILFELIKNHPAYYPAYVNLACIYWDGKDIDNAIKHFEEALRLSNYDRSVVMGYGNMLMSAKKYQRAKELFEEYLKGNPDDTEVSSLLQKCEDVLRRIKKLSQTIEKAI